MNIDVIEQAIEELENSPETIENITELASLYIVRDNLKSSGYSNSYENTATLPYYDNYLDSKRRYQLKQTTEGEVIQGIKNTCRELKEFIEILYCNTDMNKERLCIKQMLKELYEKFSM